MNPGAVEPSTVPLEHAQESPRPFLAPTSPFRLSRPIGNDRYRAPAQGREPAEDGLIQAPGSTGRAYSFRQLTAPAAPAPSQRATTARDWFCSSQVRLPVHGRRSGRCH